MTDRIALFIDGANLHTTVKNLGFEVDFRRLLSEFGKHGQIVRAYFYTVVRDDDEFSSLRRWWIGSITTDMQSGERPPSSTTTAMDGGE